MPKNISSFLNPYRIAPGHEYHRRITSKHASQSALSDQTYSKVINFLNHPPQLKSQSAPLITYPIRKTKYLSPVPNEDFCYEWNRRNVSGLDDGRLIHSIRTMQNFQVLADNSKENAFEYFLNLMSNQNKPFENLKEYQKNISYLQSIVNRLTNEQYELVRAGILLHDCGYLLDSGDSHPDASYQILANPTIQDALSLNFGVKGGYDILAMMGGYHGIIGDSYPLSRIRGITSVYNQPFDMRALAIIAALDSSAKIFPKTDNNETCFHSMMFSRTLELIPVIFGCDLTKPDQSFVFFDSDFHETRLNELRKSRLRSLFSHLNYSYISSSSYTKLLTLILCDLSHIESSLNFLLDNVFFKCWIFMKDFVSSEPIHETGYFIDRNNSSEYAFNKQYLFDYYLFLVILVKIIDELALTLRIKDYDFDVDMESKLKQEFLKDTESKKNILDNIHLIFQKYCKHNGCKLELIQDNNDFILKGDTNHFVFTIQRDDSKESKNIHITFGTGTPPILNSRKTIEVKINSSRDDMPWHDAEEKDINHIPSKSIAAMHDPHL